MSSKVNRKNATRADLTAHTKDPAVRLDAAFGDGEPQTETGAIRAALRKGLEDRFLLAG